MFILSALIHTTANIITGIDTLVWEPVVPGAKIALFLPAGGYSDKEEGQKIVRLASEYISALGFDVITCLPESGFSDKLMVEYSDSHESRSIDFGNLIASDIDVLYPLKGGAGCIDVLSYLCRKYKSELLSVRENLSKKTIVGFSDVTSLLGLTKGIHGPMLGPLAATGSFEELLSPQIDSLEKLFNLLRSQTLEFKINSKDVLIPTRTIATGKTKGLLYGGNLTLISSHLLGQQYFSLPKNEKLIFFFEDINEKNSYRINNKLRTFFDYMYSNKLLSNLAGLVFGQFLFCGNEDEIVHMISEMLKDYGLSVPAIYNFPIGHGDYNYPLPLGVEVECKIFGDYGVLHRAIET